MTSIEKQIEDTLRSIEGIKRASPKAFFFTRVQMRLRNDKPLVWERIGQMISTPRMALSLLLCIIVVNVSTLLFLAPTTSGKVNDSNHSFSTEYDIATSSYYDIENADAHEVQ